MKLLFCLECTDVIRLKSNQTKSCECGKSFGEYTDEINAHYSGPCIPIGFANRSFLYAVKNQPDNGWGKRFEAFVIEKDCPTFIRKE